MAKIPITGGTYQARLPAQNYQACINLFPEEAPQQNQPEAPVAHFRTPGATLVCSPPVAGAGRALYHASNGTLLAVVGNTCYQVNLTGSTYTMTPLGQLVGSFPGVTTNGTWTVGEVEITVDNPKNIVTGMIVAGAGIAAGTVVSDAIGGAVITLSLPTTATETETPVEFFLSPAPPAYADSTTTPCSIADNGLQAVVVNNSSYGWYVTLSDSSWSSMYDTAFVGSTLAAYVDTYFLFNEPNTPTFYCSLSLAVNFDPLYFADKEGASDYLAGVVVNRREEWLIGQFTTENWYNAGATDFPFAIMPGAFVEHGTLSAYSIAAIDSSVFWLSRDKQGQCMVMMANNYAAQRCSNHGVEFLFNQLKNPQDAVAWTLNIYGHSFYVLNFTLDDVTYAFDLATQQWFQWSSDDAQGGVHRFRGQAQTQFAGQNLVIDYANGSIYKLDLDSGLDNGIAVTRRRSFPHLVQDGKRQIHWEIVADVDSTNLTTGSATINLRWSDDRGQTWIGNEAMNCEPSDGTWQQLWTTQLGITRDRIYEFYWNDPNIQMIQGMFLQMEPCA
jgi:hypothetical protein